MPLEKQGAREVRGMRRVIALFVLCGSVWIGPGMTSFATEPGEGTHPEERPRRGRGAGHGVRPSDLQDAERLAQQQRRKDQEEAGAQHAGPARRESGPVPRQVAEHPTIGGLAGHLPSRGAGPYPGRRRVSLRPLPRPTQVRTESVRLRTRRWDVRDRMPPRGPGAHPSSMRAATRYGDSQGPLTLWHAD